MARSDEKYKNVSKIENRLTARIDRINEMIVDYRIANNEKLSEVKNELDEYKLVNDISRRVSISPNVSDCWRTIDKKLEMISATNMTYLDKKEEKKRIVYDTIKILSEQAKDKGCIELGKALQICSEEELIAGIQDLMIRQARR